MSWFSTIVVLTTSLGSESLLHRRVPSASSIHKSTHVSDCFKRIPFALTQVGERIVATNPGAGLGEIVPFETVLKDGFMLVDPCTKDNLFYYGDKFGDNKFSYDGSGNVSIIHYTDIVHKEDRKPMTPDVCFNFCRTVPNMTFFGLIHGRDCYCEPYFTPIASDSSGCSMLCEGSTVNVCGGETKSSIYSMHMCADTGAELGKALKHSKKTALDLKKDAAFVHGLMMRGQDASEACSKQFERLGDVTAVELFSRAKNRTRFLAALADREDKVSDQMMILNEKANKLEGLDLTVFDNAVKAENIVSDLSSLEEAGDKLLDEFEGAGLLSVRKKLLGREGREKVMNASQLFYPAMYFIDKAYLTDLTICNGDLVAEPQFAITLDECAYLCQSLPQSCTAISHYQEGRGVCFMFGKLHELTHYSDCLGRKNAEEEEEEEPESAVKLVQQLRTTTAEPVTKTTGEPFVWKTVSEVPDPAGLLTALQGLCTVVKDCGAMTANASLSDCSLMHSYECDTNTNWNVQKKTEVDADGVDVLSLKFNGWLARKPDARGTTKRGGERASACTVNPTPCDQCKLYSTCTGPWGETEPLKFNAGDVASYAWRSSGQIDNYEVFIGLYSKKTGKLQDYQFQRGKRQEWKTFELAVPHSGQYYLKFFLSSYDGTGGGAIGADLSIKAVMRTPKTTARSRIEATCSVKFAKYVGTSLKPDPTGETNFGLKRVTKRCLRQLRAE